MLRLNDTRKAALNAADIENDIKEQFKKETLLRDEHEEMFVTTIIITTIRLEVYLGENTSRKGFQPKPKRKKKSRRKR